MKLNFKALGKTVAKSAKRFGPAVAIIFGAAATAYGSYKMAQAIPVAKQHIAEKKAELGKDKLTLKETAQACGKDILKPAAIMTAGVAGVAGGVMGYENTVTTLTNAVGVASELISAQEKEMVKAVGEEKAAEIKKAAVESIEKKPMPNDISQFGVAITVDPQELFLDSITGRWLMSSEAWIIDRASHVYGEARGSSTCDPVLLDSLYYAWTEGGIGATKSDLARFVGWEVKDDSYMSPYNNLYFSPQRLPNGKLYKEIMYYQPAEFFYPC